MNARQAICYGRVAKARAPSGGTRILSTHPDFRRAYLANAVSQLGNALQFVALMWFAVESAGPLGVVAVRLVDALPALLFGLHGGVVADRWDRRRTMIGTDLLRGLVLLPLAVAGIAGTVPLWALVATAFVLTTGASYFTPAFAALLPSIVGKTELQRANGLVNATNAALRVGGGGRRARTRLARGVLRDQRGVVLRVRRAARPHPGRGSSRTFGSDLLVDAA